MYFIVSTCVSNRIRRPDNFADTSSINHFTLSRGHVSGPRDSGILKFIFFIVDPFLLRPQKWKQVS